MIIRKAIDKDVEAIKELYWELDADAIYYQPEHFLHNPRPNEFIKKIIDSDNSDFLLCEESGLVCGFALVMIKQTSNISCLKNQTSMYIQDLIITNTKRKQGFGSKLLEECKQYGKEHQAEYLRLSVFSKNVDGIRFYERHGLLETMKTMECAL